MSEQRFETLEVRYAQLERVVHELSDVVWKQQKTIDLLADQIRQLKDRVGQETGLVDASRTDRPPHY